MRPPQRDKQGFVLIIVIFFAMLLASTIGAFAVRARLDWSITRNRDHAARAEALARGGVQLAIALVLQDLVDESRQITAEGLETPEDAWALAQKMQIPVADGGQLSLHIEDTSTRLNLNGLLSEGKALDGAEPFLAELLEKIIGEIPGLPEEKLYDEPEELARNLLDFMDRDDVSLLGEDEDGYYQEQDPPYKADNLPLLSVDKLRLVEGFDDALVEALRPYVTVYPYVGQAGINPNTASTWMMASVHVGNGSSYELADEGDLDNLQRAKDQEVLLCSRTEQEANKDCELVSTRLGKEMFPPPSPVSTTFQVTSTARYANVERSVVAVIDRSTPAEPRLLAWRVR